MENQPNYIRSISLENVRCFGTKQTLYFTQNNQSDGEIAMWNVILGNNGTGKTTVLKSITQLNDNSKSFNSSVYVERKKKNLESKLISYYANNESILAEASTEPPFFKHTNITELPILFAYGAARKIGTLGVSEDSPDYTLSLFDEQAALLNAEKWLIDAEYLALKGEPHHQKRYELVKNTLQKLLKDEVSSFEIKTDNNVPKVYFKTYYGEVRLHELSLGLWCTPLVGQNS